MKIVKRIRYFSRLGIVAVALVWSSADIRAEDGATAAARLLRVQSMNNIDDAPLTPWHLKLSFQLMDTKGQPSEQGTIEEWWKSPSIYKVTITSPSYNGTEIHTAEGAFRSKSKDAASAPYLLELVRQQIVHPLAEGDLKNGTPQLQKESFGKVPLDCVMISQPIKRPAYVRPQVAETLGLFPTYCMDRDQDVLRANYNFGTEAVLRNNIGTFQKRMVPVELTVTAGKTVSITSHIDELRGTALEDNMFGTKDLTPITQADVASDVMAGQAVNLTKPMYPSPAKANHASGAVRIGARIGTDGRIHSLRLLSVPDADLAIAAVTAVRQWTYKPYLLNGVPVEVQTEITINFNMGN